MSRPFRVSIEGNIGSGKSTCLNYFSKMNKVEIHPEPVDNWRNVSGYNLLGLLYSDLTKWNFSFQHYVHLTRLQIQTSQPKSDDIKVKIFERSVQNNRYCFVENAYENKLLTDCEYKILQSWFDFTESQVDLSLDLIVYLKTTPEVVWRRMLKRGRTEEAAVPLDYIQKVHLAYERWLNTPNQVPCEVLVVDANQDLEGVIEQLERHTPKILGCKSNQQ